MSFQGPRRETSESGSPIYVHSAPLPFEQADGISHLEDITEHIERHLGPIENVFHEIVSDAVHVDVHVVAPQPEFPFYRLITSGMSDRSMATPDPEVPDRTELMITLPAEWQMDEESLKDTNWYWPVGILKHLARFPHKWNTWLGIGHTIPNGDPPATYAPAVRFTGSLIFPSVTVPEEFMELTARDELKIQFLAVYPLYADEMALKLKKGLDALLERFETSDVTDILDPTRPSCVRKLLGLF